MIIHDPFFMIHHQVSKVFHFTIWAVFKFVDPVPQFAVKAFKYKALDYLLKPISSEDLIDTLEYIINNNSKKSIDINKESKKITIPINNGYQIIDLNTIIYFKAEGSYCVITNLNDEKLIVSKPLKYFVDKICSDKCSFVRTHKSYLVNFNFIDKINRESNASIIMSNNEIIPISRNKKEETLEFADMFY